MFELDIEGQPQFDDRLIAEFAAQREANSLRRPVAVTYVLQSGSAKGRRVEIGIFDPE